MKGYVFTVNKSTPIDSVLSRGFFGVRLTTSPAALYGTLADFAGFQNGQKIFFFQDRWLYGIGELASPGPLHHNFLDSDVHVLGSHPGPDEKTAIIDHYDDRNWQQIAYVFSFRASPFLFNRGIDMDEALSTLHFDAWGLRFMSGKSFFELNDVDTETLTRIFLRRFANSGKSLEEESRPNPFSAELAAKFNGKQRFSLTDSVTKLNRFVMPRAGRVENENILHGMFIEALKSNPDFLPVSREGLIRTAAYHELPASPPKPPEYSDSIDVFCTLARIEDKDVPLHFEIVELKSDALPWSGETATTHLAQAMKYVDFIARNYAGGNYAAVTAYLIASDFSDDFKAVLPDVAQRTYVLDPHDPQEPSKKWDSLHLLKYSWDSSSKSLRLNRL